MSRINNRWFEHESWTKRHKKLTVGLFLTTILLFIATLGYYFQDEIKTVAANQYEKYLKQYFEKENTEEVTKKDETQKEEEPVVVDPNKPMIALTFDDGPSKYTDQLLAKLEECDARATFFVVGDNVWRRPDTMKKMAAIGCEVGNHTYTHPNLTKLTPEQIQSEINKTNQAVKAVLGYETESVRPTYGAVNDVVIQNIPYPLVHWNVDTTDWQQKDAAAVINHVLQTAQDGDIVLLHDIHATTVEAMMTLIPELKEQGYQLVTVSEMAEARGVRMEKQQKYFEFRK